MVDNNHTANLNTHSCNNNKQEKTKAYLNLNEDNDTEPSLKAIRAQCELNSNMMSRKLETHSDILTKAHREIQELRNAAIRDRTGKPQIFNSSPSTYRPRFNLSLTPNPTGTSFRPCSGQ